jgi:beta-lactamase regulating signal transducer with metallopeptidase domain/flagellar basal body-associated protein FliL
MNPYTLGGLFSTVLAVSWRAGWLVLGLMILRRVVRGRIPAQVWFLVWLVVAARLLLPFSVSARWSPFNLIAPQPSAPLDVSNRPLGPLAIRSVAPAATTASVTSTMSGQPMAAATPTSLPVVIPWWRNTSSWAAMWGAGMALLVGLHVVKVFRFRRQLHGAAETPENLRRLIAVEAAACRVRPPRILETTVVDAPALFGVFRPVLLLPVNFAGRLDDDELRLVIQHELAHHRRRDLLAHALLHAAVAVHWFNPFVWIAARLARADCELACDECVLARDSSDRATAYGKTLLKVLAMTTGRPRAHLAVGIIEGRQQLAIRLGMIATSGAWTKARIVGGLGVIGAVALISATCELRAQQKTAPSSSSAAGPAPSTAAPLSAAELRLTQAINQQQQRVEELGRALLAFKEEHHLGRLDQQRDLLGDALRTAHTEVTRATAALSALDQRLKQVHEFQARRADLADLAFIADSPVVIALKAQLLDVRTRISEAGERYAERHPTMIDLRAREQAVTNQLANEIASACRRLEADRSSAATSLIAAQAQLAKSTTECLQVDHLALELENKERLLRTERQLLEAMIARGQTNEVPLPSNQYEFKNVVVNLAGTSGTRYLKTSFVVSGANENLAAAFQAARVQLADATLSVLSSLTVADINAPDVRAAVRDQLVAAYNKMLGQTLAEHVYFSEFVVQ